MADAEPIYMPPRPAVLVRLAQFGRAALRLVLDTALPPLCAACRSPLGDMGGLCPSCWAKVSFIAPPYCERLGIPFAYDPAPACFPWRRSPIRPPMGVRGLPYASTMSRATSSTN